MDVRTRKVDEAWGLTGRGMGMQAIAGKDAEIEDLKKQLAAAEKQLAEEQANLKKTKVGKMVVRW